MPIRSPRIVAAFAFASAIVAARPALAQHAPGRALTFGAFAGGTLPVGTWATRVYDAGIQAGALAEVRMPPRWLALRVDGSYGQLGNGAQALVDETGRASGRLSTSTRVVAASANVVAHVPGLRSPVQPYALAGMSTFRLRSRVSHSDDPTRVPVGAGPVVRASGADVGVGLDALLGRARVFAEARYERMGPTVRLLPVNLGVRLR